MRELLHKAVIAGVYQTPQARKLDRTATSLYIEVVKGALEDAGLSIRDVDGVIGPNPLITEGEGRGFPGSAFAEYFGTHVRYAEQAQAGTQSPSLGVFQALEAVALGRAHAVVVPMVGVQESRAGGRDSGQRVSGDEWYSPFGMPRVASYGMFARRHMHEYGTTQEQLARVAVLARKHALLNPEALMHHRGPLSVKDVLNSRMIYEPLHLLDCCLVNEGGGAVLVTTAERARSLKHPPVYVLAYADSYTATDVYELPTLTSFGGGFTGREVFAMAGVTPRNVHVAQLSDHFTINIIIELEDLGFCGKGEGGPLVESGDVELGGRMPINTNGGYLSHSHSGSPGIFDIIELVRQLRGEAGPRQVPNARVGLYHGVGGTFISSHTAILARD